MVQSIGQWDNPSVSDPDDDLWGCHRGHSEQYRQSGASCDGNHGDVMEGGAGSIDHCMLRW